MSDRWDEASKCFPPLWQQAAAEWMREAYRDGLKYAAAVCRLRARDYAKAMSEDRHMGNEAMACYEAEARLCAFAIDPDDGVALDGKEPGDE